MRVGKAQAQGNERKEANLANCVQHMQSIRKKEVKLYAARRSTCMGNQAFGATLASRLGPFEKADPIPKRIVQTKWNIPENYTFPECSPSAMKFMYIACGLASVNFLDCESA